MAQKFDNLEGLFSVRTKLNSNADEINVLNTIYHGIETEANIKALNPTTYLNQVWRSTDTKTDFKAITKIDSSTAWQATSLEYDEETDTFKLSPTQDGQIQNLGQESFFPAYNSNALGATALNPRVFLALGAKPGEEKFRNAVQVLASDIPEGGKIGLNTTDLSAGGYGKIVVDGDLSGVNTSALGTLNQILYCSSTNKGELTNIKPTIDAWPICKITKVSPTDGILSVFRGVRSDLKQVPVGISRVFFTGDTEITTEGTFYLSKLEDTGTVESQTQLVVVPNDSVVGVAQDHLSFVFPDGDILTAGIRDGEVDISINATGGEEKIYLELYLADADGLPIDSGILTNPIGDLGVRPVITYSSSLLNLATGNIEHIEIRGQLLEDFVFPANHRVRGHLLAEKIGIVGGNKTFTFYYGSDHSTFINSFTDVNIEDIPGLEEALTERLVNGLEWSESNTPYSPNTLVFEGAWLGIPLVETSDRLAPKEDGVIQKSVPDSAVWSSAQDTSVVKNDILIQ